ncbi:hypothetical protein FKG94_24470 [Exilibacterium tricleocarpae]|uniref:Alkaline phosphatase n=1 Tax=Exilibacterium tricleocarpae TaxID=2591008 RepID=A0A545SSQ1_9GAMM|nr:alkaline phosphatase D family protein [Exilibacterium tricleocarpae]TQV67992.1 hypothetical protein FKG94_24470 [Exilibacterium tricleocarpae]
MGGSARLLIPVLKPELKLPLIPILILFSIALCLLPLPAAAQKSPERLPSHGVAVGDVTENNAVIWSRASAAAFMHATVSAEQSDKILRRYARVEADTDFTGKILFDQLRPGTRYRYRVWFSADRDSDGSQVYSAGHFKTAPPAAARVPVNFAWSGDLAGQNVCRDAREGFPIFNAINREPIDFFIGLGDMVYADGICTATGRYGNRQVPGHFQPAADLENFWAHWKYNREDTGLRKLLASLPYYAVWDDHEVVNDFGPHHDTRDDAPYTPGAALLPIGLQALLNYNPIREDPAAPHRLYRRIRWGRHLELFLLDNRQYRDANLDKDTRDGNKSMLGKTQLQWLLEGLEHSNATWKVIVSSVPISIPTGSPPELGRDSWANDDANSAPTATGIPQSATGFERELTVILKHLRTVNANALFITTDVHFASVFRYQPFADTPQFTVHEAVTGPLNAGLFPNRRFDTSFGTQRLFFYGPETVDSVKTWERARRWMNYGKIQIDKQGTLALVVADVDGKAVFQTRLQPRNADKK